MLQIEKSKLKIDTLSMQRENHAIQESLSYMESNLIKSGEVIIFYPTLCRLVLTICKIISEECCFAYNQAIQKLNHSSCIVGEFYMCSQNKASEIRKQSEVLRSLLNDKISRYSTSVRGSILNGLVEFVF